jgi:hypothetical protein
VNLHHIPPAVVVNEPGGQAFQQAGVEAVDGLAPMLAGSPVLAGSAAAALLVTVLVQRARTRRRGGAGGAGESSMAPTRPGYRLGILHVSHNR